MPEPTNRIAITESFNSEEIISNLIETARTLRQGDEEQAVAFFEKAMVLSRNAQFFNGVGECLTELAAINMAKGDISLAMTRYQEAADTFEKGNDLKKCSSCLLLLSEITYNTGSYQQALESRLIALNTARKANDLALVCHIYNKIGEVYKAIGEYEKAIENHLLALKGFESLGDREATCVTNFYIGNCYNWWNKLEEAFTYLDKSLQQADELNEPRFQVRPTGSLAILFTKLKEFDKATEYFFQAIDYVNITGELLLKADLLKSFGNLFIEKKDYRQAIHVLTESLAIAEELQIKFPKNLIHRFLAEAYELSGDHENALSHFKRYHQLSGEIMNEEVALKTRGLQLKHDLDETRKEKAEVEKAILLKDQFIANISHEIRTPLNGVLGMANLLADTYPTPEQLEYINTIKLSANNLIVTINDILDFSKIHSGGISFDNKEFKIRDLLTGIVQTARVKADEKKLQLLFQYDDQIPDVLVGDQLRLNQILSNLIGNGIKFTEKGSVNIGMKLIESRGLDIKILFTVMDTGIGISEEDIHFIFESFTQTRSENKKIVGGAGLGLAIVKHLVELQGGTLSVNSTFGEGSVFKVELPFKLTAPLEKTNSKGGHINHVAIKDLSTINVLLVEDNKVNQFLAQKLLTKMGFRVEIANNGNEAIELLKKGSFNVILMDVQMPEMNGYELTQKIRTTLRSPVNTIPIVALTAYASTQEKEKALALGMSDYITKPYSPHELLTAILRQVQPSASRPPYGNHAHELITEADIRLSSEKLIQLFSGSQEDVLSLLHMLIGQIPQLIAESETHIQSANWPATFQSIHKLKSSINLLKINLLRDSVAELEEFSRDQIQTDRIPPAFAEFKKACDRTVGLLKDEVIRLKKSV